MGCRDGRHLRIKPDDLRRKIQDALLRSARTDAMNISVGVDGNRAILKGTVHSATEKREVERAAWLAPGITAGWKQLVVSADGRPRDYRDRLGGSAPGSQWW